MPPGPDPAGRDGRKYVRALEFFGGAGHAGPRQSGRVALNKACFYDPELNPSYVAGPFITPPPSCRPGRIARKPRLKAEAGVLLVERWALA